MDRSLDESIAERQVFGLGTKMTAVSDISLQRGNNRDRRPPPPRRNNYPRDGVRKVSQETDLTRYIWLTKASQVRILNSSYDRPNTLVLQE